MEEMRGKVKKVLIFGLSSLYAGVEALILNYVNHLDENEYAVDLVVTERKPEYLDDKLLRNVDIRIVPNRVRNYVAYVKSMDKIVKTGGYDIIWANFCTLTDIQVLKSAQKYDVPIRIAHSHNSENMGSFLVMATQNPIEQEGTYPLPEAQVDRFMLKVIIDYPKLEEEKKIIRQNITGEKIEVRPILKATDIMEARKVVRQVYLDEKIEQYIADIVFATRFPEKYDLKELKDMIGFGGSPRASINLALAARSYAFIKRRGYVIPEDVRAVAHDVLRHRIGLTYEAEAMNMSSDEIVSKILNKVEVP